GGLPVRGHALPAAEFSADARGARGRILAQPAFAARHGMTAAITVHNLHKRFGPLEVLKGISLDANEGEVISIIGASGSGKSTLLRCIPLLEVPDEGEIAVAGETIRMRRRHGRPEPADGAQVNR